MNITPVPELERLLDAAEATGRMNGPEWDAYADAVDTDTLRALVNVAKSARHASLLCLASGCDACMFAAALAPLFPDEESGVAQDAQQCPTCNGHGGGAGFADEYREYPCPTCGKAWDGIEEATDE